MEVTDQMVSQAALVVVCGDMNIDTVAANVFCVFRCAATETVAQMVSQAVWVEGYGDVNNIFTTTANMFCVFRCAATEVSAQMVSHATLVEACGDMDIITTATTSNNTFVFSDVLRLRCRPRW